MNRLKELREKHNYNQSEIAQLLNITQSNYSRWENGKVKIDNKSLKKLSEFYKVSIDYILDNSKATIVSQGGNLEIRELTPLEKENIKDIINQDKLELTQEEIKFLKKFINNIKNNQ